MSTPVENEPAKTKSTNPKHHSRSARVVAGMALAFVGLALIACQWRPDAMAALTLIPAWCWPTVGLLTAIPVVRRRTVRELFLLQLFWVLFSMRFVEELMSVTSFTSFAQTDIGQRQPKPGFTVVRVVTLNCANSAACSGDLRRVDPDIVLLQEAPSAGQLAITAAEIFGNSGAFLWGGDTAILARGRIEPLVVDRAAHFVAAVVQLENGTNFDCVSLRLSPPPARLDFWSPLFWSARRDLLQQHRKELQQIKQRLTGKWRGNLAIVGGDFNCVPLDRASDELRPYFSDQFASGGRGWGSTGTNEWPLFRVDQIWMTTSNYRSRTSAVRTNSSDHRMVVCDILIPE